MASNNNQQQDQQGGKHRRDCPSCKGKGTKVQMVMDRKAGTTVPHTLTCNACQGTGQA